MPRTTTPVGIESTVDKRMGRWQLLGRYHKLPRKFEDDYRLENKVLGSGLSGTVELATGLGERSQDHRFAVKTFNTSRMGPKARTMLKSEVEVYLCMDHPHIARLVNVYETKSSLSLVMECMEGGELFDRISAEQRLTEDESARVARQMLLAVNYLHSHGIVHRDLKLENFMYELKDGHHLKLLDFGFSKFRDPNCKMKTACGTLSYVAPEVLGDLGYGVQCDMWSLGVILFVLLGGYMPFAANNAASQRKRIIAGDYVLKPTRWKNISQEAQSFAKEMLEINPDERLTSKKALNHPWIMKFAAQTKGAELDVCVVNSLKDFRKAPMLRRCCLKAMAWLLSHEETDMLRHQFELLDADLGGTITLGELKNVMVNRCNVRSSDVDLIFQAIDMNHDSEINYTDFLAATIETSIGISDGLLKATFRHFDADLSGYIDTKDLKEMIGATSFEGNTIEAMIRDADALNDGRINYEEFAAFVRGKPFDVDHWRESRDLADFRKMPLRWTPEPHVRKDLKDLKQQQACCCIQ